MSIALETRRYGTEAYLAVASLVRAAKGGDPLAPVTVIVDRVALGLSLRRRMAAEPPGIANVRFSTWATFGAELAAPWLSAEHRRPADGSIELEAARAVLCTAPQGRLVFARDKMGTARALARTYRDLASVSAEALARLASQGARAEEVVELVRAMRARLGGCYDPTAVLYAASAEVRGTPSMAAAHVGAAVVHLPARIEPAQEALLRALASAVEVTVSVGLTGDADADALADSLVARLAPPWPEPTSGRSQPSARRMPRGPDSPADFQADRTGVPPPVSWVRSAPSADAEVLMALRQVMRRHAAGTPLTRMAILHSGAPPYPRLLHDAAAMAEIPVYGGSARSLLHTVPGRVLMGVLSLPDHDWRRDDVIALAAGAPLLHKGRPVPAVQWDVLSKDAGVVAGLEQWQDRLGLLGRTLRGRARLAHAASDVTAPGVSGVSGEALECDARCCADLSAFVVDLSARLAGSLSTWDGWAEWSHRLLVDLLGGPAHRAAWPGEEVAAFDAVMEVIGSVGALDWVGGPPPTRADVRAALLAQLESSAPETARFGRGLLVGRIADAVGLDFDLVCIVGMVDGAFLAPEGDDVLVSDRDRGRAGPDIPLRRRSHAEARRAYFAALASAPDRIVSYSRMDQRRGRELRPARMLLDTLEHALAGAGQVRRLYPRDVRDGPPAGVASGCFDYVHSFAEAIRDEGNGAGEPLSERDWRLRSLARWTAEHGDVQGHFLAREGTLGGALRARAGRRSTRFTRFDGLVQPVRVPSPVDAVQSASRFEAYARCPRSYFLESVLEVRVRRRPEFVLQLPADERGILVHRVLERLVALELEERAAGMDPASREETIRRVEAIAVEELAATEASGLGGYQALWTLERARVLHDVFEFVNDDASYRQETGAMPIAVEERFGCAADSEVAVDIGGARGVRFRGRIDRVDLHPDGVLAVIDYKTGRAHDVVADEDPVAGGTRLQLPLYALAARARHDPSARTRAGYWHVGTDSGPRLVDVATDSFRRFQGVVRSMVDGIETGVFPANPGELKGEHAVGEHCRTCSFDKLCPRDRAHSWARKRADRALEVYTSLASPPARNGPAGQ